MNKNETKPVQFKCEFFYSKVAKKRPLEDDMSTATVNEINSTPLLSTSKTSKQQQNTQRQDRVQTAFKALAHKLTNASSNPAPSSQSLHMLNEQLIHTHMQFEAHPANSIASIKKDAAVAVAKTLESFDFKTMSSELNAMASFVLPQELKRGNEPPIQTSPRKVNALSKVASMVASIVSGRKRPVDTELKTDTNRSIPTPRPSIVEVPFQFKASPDPILVTSTSILDPKLSQTIQTVHAAQQNIKVAPELELLAADEHIAKTAVPYTNTHRQATENREPGSQSGHESVRRTNMAKQDALDEKSFMAKCQVMKQEASEKKATTVVSATALLPAIEPSMPIAHGSQKFKIKPASAASCTPIVPLQDKPMSEKSPKKLVPDSAPKKLPKKPVIKHLAKPTDPLIDVLDSFTHPISTKLDRAILLQELTRAHRKLTKQDMKSKKSTKSMRVEDEMCFFCEFEQFFSGTVWEKTRKRT